MSKRTFNLVVGITGVVVTAAGVIVNYFEPAYGGKIIAAAGIIQTAVTEICSLFRKD